MNRSEIFKAAWQLRKDNVFPTFGEALKAAWQRHKLTNQLKNGIAYFSFTKEDGTTRLAIGTLREGNFNYQPKTKGDRKPNANLITYFDLEKRNFRAVRLDRLLTIN